MELNNNFTIILQKKYKVMLQEDDDNHYLPPPIPLNEVERRWRFQILNTSNDVNFTRIVALSKEHFKTSISMISLLNTTHQWFKAEDNMGCSETTREISFCHAILQENGEPFVIPLKIGDFILCWRSLRTDDGGTICVIDREPRDSFSKKDRGSLKEFAKVVMRELEL
ncbi:hypothetical protein RhiirA4_464604 [Rhizophagus irregularis]|uniref:Uncharacterized protein n=1 Tax=Rhizophagus irregularis TaxID=588596 RepID=A0A2I1GQE6_9GLOM|nr:hypothetical protein RhiirA4_464604 [Rhizophagus irregularis]